MPGTGGHEAQVGRGVSDFGIEERLGESIPLNAVSYDEEGNSAMLGALVGDKPAIIVPAYYRCRNLCTTILDETAKVLGDLRLKAGKDFRVITVSFNELETPKEALIKYIMSPE